MCLFFFPLRTKRGLTENHIRMMRFKRDHHDVGGKFLAFPIIPFMVSQNLYDCIYSSIYSIQQEYIVPHHKCYFLKGTAKFIQPKVINWRKRKNHVYGLIQKGSGKRMKQPAELLDDGSNRTESGLQSATERRK